MGKGLSFEQMFPYVAAVGDYLGGLKPIYFDDGAWQFKIEGEETIVYSPRLKPDDLEKFCQDNFEQYEKFYDENERAVEGFESLPPIKLFWINGTR